MRQSSFSATFLGAMRRESRHGNGTDGYWASLDWSSQWRVLLRSRDSVEAAGGGALSCGPSLGTTVARAHREKPLQRVLQRLPRLQRRYHPQHRRRTHLLDVALEALNAKLLDNAADAVQRRRNGDVAAGARPDGVSAGGAAAQADQPVLSGTGLYSHVSSTVMNLVSVMFLVKVIMVRARGSTIDSSTINAAVLSTNCAPSSTGRTATAGLVHPLGLAVGLGQQARRVQASGGGVHVAGTAWGGAFRPARAGKNKIFIHLLEQRACLLLSERGVRLMYYYLYDDYYC